MNRTIDGQALYNWLFAWQQRLKKQDTLSEEEFGQLLTVNTVLWWIDDKQREP